MKILGFNFTKVAIEKFSDKFQDLKVNTNIDVKEITEIDNNMLKSSNNLLGVKFANNFNYDPKIAKIEFEGTILLEVEKDKSQKILENWKTKKLESDFKMPLFNLILRKSSIKALQFEDEFNLPLHAPLPSLTEKKKE